MCARKNESFGRLLPWKDTARWYAPVRSVFIVSDSSVWELGDFFDDKFYLSRRHATQEPTPNGRKYQIRFFHATHSSAQMRFQIFRRKFSYGFGTILTVWTIQSAHTNYYTTFRTNMLRDAKYCHRNNVIKITHRIKLVRLTIQSCLRF